MLNVFVKKKHLTLYQYAKQLTLYEKNNYHYQYLQINCYHYQFYSTFYYSYKFKKLLFKKNNQLCNSKTCQFRFCIKNRFKIKKNKNSFYSKHSYYDFKDFTKSFLTFSTIKKSFILLKLKNISYFINQSNYQQSFNLLKNKSKLLRIHPQKMKNTYQIQFYFQWKNQYLYQIQKMKQKFLKQSNYYITNFFAYNLLYKTNPDLFLSEKNTKISSFFYEQIPHFQFVNSMILFRSKKESRQKDPCFTINNEKIFWLKKNCNQLLMLRVKHLKQKLNDYFLKKFPNKKLLNRSNIFKPFFVFHQKNGVVLSLSKSLIKEKTLCQKFKNRVKNYTLCFSHQEKFNKINLFSFQKNCYILTYISKFLFLNFLKYPLILKNFWVFYSEKFLFYFLNKFFILLNIQRKIKQKQIDSYQKRLSVLFCFSKNNKNNHCFLKIFYSKTPWKLKFEFFNFFQISNQKINSSIKAILQYKAFHLKIYLQKFKLNWLSFFNKINYFSFDAYKNSKMQLKIFFDNEKQSHHPFGIYQQNCLFQQKQQWINFFFPIIFTTSIYLKKKHFLKVKTFCFVQNKIRFSIYIKKKKIKTIFQLVKFKKIGIINYYGNNVIDKTQLHQIKKRCNCFDSGKHLTVCYLYKYIKQCYVTRIVKNNILLKMQMLSKNFPILSLMNTKNNLTIPTKKFNFICLNIQNPSFQTTKTNHLFNMKMAMNLLSKKNKKDLFFFNERCSIYLKKKDYEKKKIVPTIKILKKVQQQNQEFHYIHLSMYFLFYEYNIYQNFHLFQTVFSNFFLKSTYQIFLSNLCILQLKKKFFNCKILKNFEIQNKIFSGWKFFLWNFLSQSGFFETTFQQKKIQIELWKLRLSWKRSLFLKQTTFLTSHLCYLPLPSLPLHPQNNSFSSSEQFFNFSLQNTVGQNPHFFKILQQFVFKTKMKIFKKQENKNQTFCCEILLFFPQFLQGQIRYNNSFDLTTKSFLQTTLFASTQWHSQFAEQIIVSKDQNAKHFGSSCEINSCQFKLESFRPQGHKWKWCHNSSIFSLLIPNYSSFSNWLIVDSHLFSIKNGFSNFQNEIMRQFASNYEFDNLTPKRFSLNGLLEIWNFLLESLFYTNLFKNYIRHFPNWKFQENPYYSDLSNIVQQTRVLKNKIQNSLKSINFIDPKIRFILNNIYYSTNSSFSWKTTSHWDLVNFFLTANPMVDDNFSIFYIEKWYLLLFSLLKIILLTNKKDQIEKIEIIENNRKKHSQIRSCLTNISKSSSNNFVFNFKIANYLNGLIDISFEQLFQMFIPISQKKNQINHNLDFFFYFKWSTGPSLSCRQKHLFHWIKTQQSNPNFITNHTIALERSHLKKGLKAMNTKTKWHQIVLDKKFERMKLRLKILGLDFRINTVEKKLVKFNKKCLSNTSYSVKVSSCLATHPIKNISFVNKWKLLNCNARTIKHSGEKEVRTNVAADWNQKCVLVKRKKGEIWLTNQEKTSLQRKKGSLCNLVSVNDLKLLKLCTVTKIKNCQNSFSILKMKNELFSFLSNIAFEKSSLKLFFPCYFSIQAKIKIFQQKNFSIIMSLLSQRKNWNFKTKQKNNLCLTISKGQYQKNNQFDLFKKLSLFYNKPYFLIKLFLRQLNFQRKTDRIYKYNICSTIYLKSFSILNYFQNKKVLFKRFPFEASSVHWDFQGIKKQLLKFNEKNWQLCLLKNKTNGSTDVLKMPFYYCFCKIQKFLVNLKTRCLNKTLFNSCQNIMYYPPYQQFHIHINTTFGMAVEHIMLL
eukprot:TRINITY_DN130_c1_g1_i6.p1 TRINITY_DN130_c1_g1~~TRINITY_DN130_c1_g1_i6.p1  ORF type:complete len:1826 (+),score=10.92 TRINITY_DN130_c1_g1_i6:233-5479(+)